MHETPKGWQAYLQERIQRARADGKEFQALGNAAMAALAQRWVNWYIARQEQFDRALRDLGVEVVTV